MKIILVLILVSIFGGTLLIMRNNQLPEPLKVGNCIGIKGVVLYPETYRVVEIRGKWVHLERAVPKGIESNSDFGWWNADMIAQVTSREEP